MALENRGITSFCSKGTGLFAADYEKVRVPLLSCKPLLVQVLSGPFPVTLWGLGLWEPVQECADTLATGIGLSSKFFCV